MNNSNPNHIGLGHSSTQRQNPQHREAIVDKLNGALAVLRRERDELHRTKELAMERLRLAKEERMSMEKSVRTIQNKLHKLSSSVSGEGNQAENNDISKAQQEVERLTREVRIEADTSRFYI